MAAPKGNMGGGGGGIGPGYLQQYIKRNIYIKYFFLLFIFLFLILGAVFLLTSTQQGYKIAKTYNQIIEIISGLLSFIPIYNLWTDNFNAYQYYIQFSYELNQQFFQSYKEIIYIKKFFLETLPFIVASFAYTKYFFDLRGLFKDYYKTLKYRNLKLIDNPVKKLETGFVSEGVDNDDYDEEQLKSILKFYNKSKFNKIDDNLKLLGLIDIYKIKLKNNIKLYYNSLFKLKLELNNQEKWDNFFNNIIDKKEQPYEYLKLFRYKNIDYKLLDKKELQRLKDAFKWEIHFKYHNLKKKWVSREFYIDSSEKCIEHSDIYNYYYTTFLFWINKQWTNFPMYIYTINLDTPPEWKKLAKWSDGLNAPGKTSIIMETKGKSIKLKTVDLYFRLFMFRNYLGIECEYMTDYLLIINKKYGI